MASAQVNVLTSDYGAGRTGANLSETQLTVQNVTPGSFGLLGVFPTDGQIFAQPLYVSNLNIPGQGTVNVLFVTTEHNTVYAYDADSAASPNLLWTVKLGPAVPSSTVPTDASSGPFIDVNPELGVLSTPAIDLQSSVMYVVAEVLTSNGPQFRLHALDLATGQEKLNGPANITATFAGTGSGSKNGVVTFDPSQHIQRPGLLLANGAVYVAFGSHSDFGLWHGWVMSYDASDLSHRLNVFQATPNGNGGAIWQSGRGLAADDAGNVYFVTGNGDYDGAHNFSESFVKLSGGNLSLADWYTPANWQFLTDNDYDLSAGPAIVPGTHQLIGGDKNGNVYLVNGDSMGHLDSGGAAQITKAVGGFIFSFALWARPDAAYLYLRETDGTFKEFRITGGSLDPNPVSVSEATSGAARVGMALSANDSQDGSGILWVTTGDYFDPSVPATLHAFDATNLGNEIWNSDMNEADNLNGFAKFASPTVANGTVYAPSSSVVMVYGLVPDDDGGDPVPPVISAVENSASYGTAAISPGELITIFGTNLGPFNPAGTQLDGNGNVATNLAGVQVLVDGVAAPLIFAGPNQVNAVLPFGTSSTVAQIVVLNQDQVSQAFPMPVQPATPALFAADSSGSGQALAINPDGTMNSADSPAPANSVMVLYATGAGQTSPASQDGAVATADQLLRPVLPVTATIGGLPAQVLYAGSAPGMVEGALQINLVIPANATGPSQPVVLKVGNQSSQDALTLAIR